MSEVSENKPSILYWIVTGVLVLWGLMGLWVYYSFVTSTPESLAEYVAKGTYSQEYADYYLNGYKTWHVAVFAIAIFSGALGALCLVLRRAWAVPLYILSLLMIIASFIGTFAIDKAHTMMTSGQIAMESVVLLIALFSVWFALRKKAKGWLT